MTLLDALRSGYGPLSYPGGHGQLAGRVLNHGELVVGESEVDRVGSSLAGGGPAAGSFVFHETDITVKQKTLASPELMLYDKYMNTHTTTTQNAAHRTDVAWVKSTGKSFKVNDENYLSEYRNIVTGQSIRKGWRMTGQDWFIFNEAEQITGRSHSLTWAKYEAAEVHA